MLANIPLSVLGEGREVEAFGGVIPTEVGELGSVTEAVIERDLLEGRSAPGVVVLWGTCMACAAMLSSLRSSRSLGVMATDAGAAELRAEIGGN
jgi:hypothetical protein